MLRLHLNRKNPCRPRESIPLPQPEPEPDSDSDLWTEFLNYLGIVNNEEPKDIWPELGGNLLADNISSHP